MATYPRKLLAALKTELRFVEEGGYRKLTWRLQCIFEDSPTCLNFNDPDHRRPCSECILMPLIPESCRDKNIPCRHIPLNDAGETVASLYRWATQEEMEKYLVSWLKKTIGLSEMALAVDRTQAANPSKSD